MRTLILTLFILLSAPAAQAQKRKPELVIEPCKLTIDQVPEVRGLRLGQPFEILKTIFPSRFGLIDFDDRDEYGIRRVSIYPSSIAKPESLSGVRSVDLMYFDDVLKSISISYSPDVEWQSNLHFVAAVAEQLRLPRDGWLRSDPSYLFCQGFAVTVGHALTSPYVRILDLAVGDETFKRRAEVEEKKRARFRP